VPGIYSYVGLLITENFSFLYSKKGYLQLSSVVHFIKRGSQLHRSQRYVESSTLSDAYPYNILEKQGEEVAGPNEKDRIEKT
jgi:hypothetical protein